MEEKKQNTFTIVVFIYTCIATYISYVHIEIEQASFFLLFTCLGSIFIPIILSAYKSKSRKILINLTTLIAYTIVTYIWAAYIIDSNIWPIVLLSWVALSVPVIFVFNLVCYAIEVFIKKA